MSDDNSSTKLSKTKITGLVVCAVYQLCFMIYVLHMSRFLAWEGDLTNVEMAIRFLLIGIIAGNFYCLRSLYIHGSVHRDWDNYWILWQIIRPFTSAASATFAFILIKAGLILLDSDKEQDESQTLWGFYFLALIAGLNVDKFHQKIEEIGKTLFGVEKSNLARKNNES